MKRLRNLIKLFTLALFFFAIAYWLMVSPITEALEQARNEEGNLKHTLETRQQFAANLEPLKQSYQELNQRLRGLNTIFPRRVWESDVLNQLVDLANRNGVVISTLNFDRARRHDFYVTHPFSFEASGTFREIVGFLHELLHKSQPLVLGGDFTLRYVPGKNELHLRMVGMRARPLLDEAS